MAQIWQLSPGLYRGSIQSVADDRPTVQWLPGRGVRLELTGRDAVWTIELTADECRQISELIGYGIPLDWPARGDN